MVSTELYRARSAAKWEPYLLGVLILVSSLAQWVWIARDTRPQPFIDPYPTKTLRFVDDLQRLGFARFPSLVMRMAVGGRPPLYQLLAVPFVYLAGRNADAMLLLNIVFGVLLVCCTYGIGESVQNSKAGLLAAFLVATYPPIANLTRIARPHAVVPACVALSVWLLLWLLNTRSFLVAWLLGASLAFGFLIHPVLLFLTWIPSFLLAVYMTFFQTKPRWPRSLEQALPWLWTKLRDPLVLIGLFPAAAIAIGGAMLWIVPAMDQTLGLVRQLATLWTDLTYGFPNVPPSVWWYVLTMPGAISYVFTALLAVSLAASVLRWRRQVFVLAVVFLLMMVILGVRRGTMGWMYGAAVLPVAAALTAAFVVDLSERARSGGPARQEVRHPRPPTLAECIPEALSLALLWVCISTALFNWAFVSWEMSPWGAATAQAVARVLGAPADSTCGWRMNVAFCPNPPRDEEWPLSGILQVIADDPDREARLYTLAVVTSSSEHVNHSSLGYHLVRDFPGLRLNIVRIRDVSSSRDPNLNWLTSDYIMYIPQLKTDGYANVVVSFLEDPPDAFRATHQELASLPCPQDWTAKVIKRTQPLAFEEAVTSISVLNIPRSHQRQLLDRARTMAAHGQVE